MSELWTLWLPIALLIAGAVALIRGWRGRRLDDHPICAECRFDLFGLPESSKVCPECGQGIYTPASIRIGNRERRSGLILLGVVLLLPAVSWLGMVGWIAARGANFDRHKPVWWLLREVSSSSTRHSDRRDLLREILSRLQLKKLSDDQLDAITTRALDIQGESFPNLARWDEKWDEILEQSRIAGKLSDQKWKRYAEQSVHFRFRVRPDVRRGDPIPMQVDNWQRGAYFDRRYRVMLKLNDKEVPFQPTYFRTKRPYFTDTTLDWTIKPDDPNFATLADGAHEAKVVIDIDILDSLGANARPGAPLFTKKQIIATAKWRLHPADAPTVRLNRDPALREGIESALRVRELEVSSSSAGTAKQYAYLTMDPTPGRHGQLPVGIACDVFLSTGTREWKLGHPIHLGADMHGSRWFATDATIEDLSATRVDVILRPSPEAAANTFDLFEIWNQEIRIREVQVKHTRPPK